MKTIKSIKLRAVAAILSFITVVTSFAFAPTAKAASDYQSVRFSSSDSMAYFAVTNNVNVTYSDAEEAALVTVTGDGGDPWALVNVESAVNVSATTDKYLVVTYRTPTTNSSKAVSSELFLCAGEITAPTANSSVQFTPVNGYKYRSQIIDLSNEATWTGAVHSVRLDAFRNATPGDAFYLYSLSFCDSVAEANSVSLAESTAANGVTSDISEEALATKAYSYDTYVDNRFWNSEIVYNESIYPLENPDGTISPIPLMYDAKRIISVKNGTLGTEYKYGVDYVLTDGKLQILKTGNIKTIPYANYKQATKPADTLFWQPCKDGSYTYFSEGSVFHSAQLAITYTHEDSWQGYIPESKTLLLPKTVAKLQNKQHVTVVFNGDSITVGANASGLSGIEVHPNMPNWADMTIEGLKRHYGYTDISYANTAKGGETSTWGAENAYNNIAIYGADLVFIAYGMNDGTLQTAPETVIANIKTMMASARGVNPNCEFIIVAPILANSETYFSGNQASYLDHMKALEGPGVAVVDMTSIHQYLLGIKKYSDMTGNNVNHPNDFLIRFYAQSMMTALVPAALDEAKANAIKVLSSYADPSLYLEAERLVLAQAVKDGIDAINAAQSENGVNTALLEAKAEIDEIKTAAEYELENFDYTRLVFDGDAPYLLITKRNNISVAKDSATGSATLTSTGDDPYIRITYPQGAVSANTYKYAVLVYKVPDTSSTASAQMFYTTGSNSSESETASRKFTPVKGTFQCEVFDLSEDAYWSGNVNTVRLDTFSSYSAGDVMYLCSLCLYKTADEALYYGEREAAILNGTFVSQKLYSDFNTANDVSKVSVVGETFEKGDINADGRITSLDLSALKHHLAGTADISNGCPDVDSDGRYSIKDSLYLRRIIAGIVSSPGVYTKGFASVGYDPVHESVCITSLGGGEPQVEFDISDKEADFGRFKYVTIVYSAPVGTSFTASAYVKTENGQTSTESFDIISAEEKSITLDFRASTLNGNVTKLSLSLGEDSMAGGKIYVKSIILSD